MKCLECGSSYARKVGPIVAKDKVVGKYKIPNAEYFECKNCGDRLYPFKTCQLLDKERLKTMKKRLNMKFEKYEHHGENVWVRSDLKGKHRENCLCMVCKKLDVMNSKKNCPIANAVFKNCKKFNLVTPMWECPKFDEKK